MKVAYTEEQGAAIDWARQRKRFALIAPAGSGKSITALGMAMELQHLKVLYLVFNREARRDAEKKFALAGADRWTDVRTTSQLAWREYAYLKGQNGEPDPNYGTRMEPGATAVTAREVAQKLRIGEIDFGGLVLDGYMQARLALDAVEVFCNSDRASIEPEDVPLQLEDFKPVALKAARIEIARRAQKLWQQSIRPQSGLRFTMNHAFKLIAENADLDYGYDVILLDEAQDSNDATMKFLANQKNSQVILIGDPAQALYEWRGASDQLVKFDAPRLHLTRSFRFGNAVAEEAMKHLPHTKTGVTVQGLPSIKDRVTDGQMSDPDVVLCRSNSGSMEWAMSFLETGKRVALVRGEQRIKSLAFAASDLRAGRPPRNAELGAFSTWDELVEYTKEPGGGHLKPLVNLVNAYGVSRLIAACDKMTPYNSHSPQHDVAITTCHSVKGLEWENVLLADDFTQPLPHVDLADGKVTLGEIDRHEAMIHYVAVTRARRHLDRSGANGLGWIDEYTAPQKLQKLQDAPA